MQNIVQFPTAHLTAHSFATTNDIAPTVPRCPLPLLQCPQPRPLPLLSRPLPHAAHCCCYHAHSRAHYRCYRAHCPMLPARRLNWQKLFSGAVSLVCWRLRRWFPATHPIYGVQVDWNSGSIRHLAPPRGHSHNIPRIESAPGCGPGSASAAPAGEPERAAAS